MDYIFNFLLGFFLYSGILILSLFLIISLVEKENPAAKRSAALILILLPFIVLYHFGYIPYVFQFYLVSFMLTGILLIISRFGNHKIKILKPEKQFDERDIMFSRNELKEGTEKFEDYYSQKSDKKLIDDLFRKEPGLLSPESKLYDTFHFKAAEATFSTIELLYPLVEAKEYLNKTNSNFKSNEISAFIKNWAKKLGVADIGFTELQTYHTYSRIGRGEKYGEQVDLQHKYAIAFTVEMNHESMSFNPKGPVIAESAQQYLRAGTVAVQLAQFIRNLGFDARAHIDANYRVICPIVAQDAGLGTIGRMGLLITPKLGPRVRIGVVTTNFQLITNTNPIDSSIIHFCEICKKCATNCPSKAISTKSLLNGIKYKRRTINHESCFTYWCKIGTDCGRCMAVCPYSHPDNFFHSFIRWMIKRNSFNRWLVLKLDHFFYRKKPTQKKLEYWMMPKNYSK